MGGRGGKELVPTEVVGACIRLRASPPPPLFAGATVEEAETGWCGNHRSCTLKVVIDDDEDTHYNNNMTNDPSHVQTRCDKKKPAIVPKIYSVLHFSLCCNLTHRLAATSIGTGRISLLAIFQLNGGRSGTGTSGTHTLNAGLVLIRSQRPIVHDPNQLLKGLQHVLP